MSAPDSSFNPAHALRAMLAIEAFDEVPQIDTRQALLVLDLQNDMLAADAKLPVRCPSDLVERIGSLLPDFRRSADVVWVRTEFQGPRIVNDEEGVGEAVITDLHLLGRPHAESGSTDSVVVDGHAFRASSLAPRALQLLQRVAARTAEQSAEDASIGTTIECEETFLGPTESEQSPRCCLPGSVGAAFSPAVAKLVEEAKDSCVVKSHYSAFHDTNLIPLLRGSLVTDLFICGLISNVSVYATALDAVRHGYSVTLVEDCLGYRSAARHAEAMRQMKDFMGAEVITSHELLEELHHAAAEEAVAEKRLKERDQAVMDAYIAALHAGGAPSTNGATWSADGADRPSSAPADQAAPPSTDSAVSLSGDRLVEDEIVSGRHDTPSPGEDGHDPRPPSQRSGMPGDDGDRSPSADRRPDEVASIAAADRADPEPTPSRSSSQPPTPPPLPREMAARMQAPPAKKARVYRPPERRSQKSQSAALRPGNTIGEGDSRILYDLLPPPLKDDAFDRLKAEVSLHTMSHRGGEVPRRVAVQGSVADDGAVPLYRHPADESPALSAFSPVVREIKEAVEQAVQHPVNHVLIQHYRDGHDHISEHSDKTLDILRRSTIANVSLGAERTMTLRRKKGSASASAGGGDGDGVDGHSDDGPHRTTQRIPMPHNSLFVLGPQTNQRWLHGIRPDKRPATEKAEAELACGGERISLTFRHVATFMHARTRQIWGQGARSKARAPHAAAASLQRGGGNPDADAMLAAFGRENHERDFDWPAVYGAGFDAVDLGPRRPTLHLSGHALSDRRVRLHLAESGVAHDVAEAEAGAEAEAVDVPPDALIHDRIRFVDGDPAGSEVAGALAIMLYLEAYHRPGGALTGAPARPDVARALTRFGEAHGLLACWEHARLRAEKAERAKAEKAATQAAAPEPEPDPDPDPDPSLLQALTQTWEPRLAQADFVAGRAYSVADSAFWPVLDDIRARWRAWHAHAPALLPALERYHARVAARESVGRMRSEDREGEAEAKTEAEGEWEGEGDGRGGGGGGGGAPQADVVPLLV
ncbi:MAG: hypothetical protein M1826_003684 [Phylliscum demangeonii]|nr:MAG: hypothetical protein M1826_003684 [Phylliscum demangeonii]